MEAKKVKAELQKHEAAVVKALNRILEGKTATDIPLEVLSNDEEIMAVFGENIKVTGLNFCGEEEGYDPVEEYVNGTINCNMLGYSMEDGGRYNMFTGEPTMWYDPAKWFFFWFNYDREIEEPSHVAAYNPETQKLDILCINYSAPENWFIEKSTWLIRKHNVENFVKAAW